MRMKALLAGLLALASVGLSAQTTPQYGFKSAIVTISTQMLGNTIESTAYIDDYGAKTSQVVVMNIPLKGEVKSATIVRDGQSYTVNYNAKKIEVADAIEQPNLQNPTDADKEKYNITELTEDTVLGKRCKVYSLTTDYNGSPATMTAWCYKGYVLKSETDLGFMKVNTVATSFEENVDVPQDVFEIPDYKIKKKK